MKTLGRIARTSVALGAVSALVIRAGGMAAWADNAVSDGDGVAPVANNDAALGAVPCGSATAFPIPVAVSRNGGAGSTNVFKDGSTVTISVLSVSGAGLSATVPAANTITIPPNWSMQPNNSMSGYLTANVTVSSAVAGPGSGTVTFRASGVNSSNAAITRDDSMAVSWTTGTCVPADSTPPIITPTVVGMLGTSGGTPPMSLSRGRWSTTSHRQQLRAVATRPSRQIRLE